MVTVLLEEANTHDFLADRTSAFSDFIADGPVALLMHQPTRLLMLYSQDQQPG